MNFKGIFIDIDDTLLRFKEDSEAAGNTGSLMQVLVNAGVELGKLSTEESQARVDWVNKNVRWWSWDHFIDKLNINHEEFWQYAYEQEKDYMEPTEDDLPASLKKLKNYDLNLFITSNNPNSGIRHKLRLAGFSNLDIEHIFSGLLGATELQNMKWESEYWRQAVQASQIPIDQIAVVGDSLNDDFEIPQSVGITFTFLIDPNHSQAKRSNLQPVSGFKEITAIFQQQGCLV